MRLCRFQRLDAGSEKRPESGRIELGFYFAESGVIPLTAAARHYEDSTHRRIEVPADLDLTPCLPPDGGSFGPIRDLNRWLQGNLGGAKALYLKPESIRLLAPCPRPQKLFLLAGNYAKHIEEGGGIAVARARTFPYVFMKPPSTTINHPDSPVTIPAVSPDHIDWEAELGVIIGRRARRVPESEALKYVAGYSCINDISDRQFRPNPGRQPRERDAFFDWLHGKWHDGFCPMGPCVLTADELPEPQQLTIQLRVNGDLKQNASTAQMIFPVAAVIEFISNFVTLEPGDVISTGTPDGVGSASGTFLKAGDRVEVSIEKIGVLRNHMAAEA